MLNLNDESGRTIGDSPGENVVVIIGGGLGRVIDSYGNSGDDGRVLAADVTAESGEVFLRVMDENLLLRSPDSFGT